MLKVERHAIVLWASLGVLALLCSVLAVLQYRWIGEISRAEQERLQAGLQLSLNRISQDFTGTIGAASAALIPGEPEIEDMGKQAAYASRYSQWRETAAHGRLFKRIGIAEPREKSIVLYVVDPQTAQFAAAEEWPDDWKVLRERLLGGIVEGQPGPYAPAESMLIEVPRFGRPEAGSGRREQEWLILELDAGYLRTGVFPQLLERHLGPAAEGKYAIQIRSHATSAQVIYSSEDARLRIGKPDAVAGLFDPRALARPGPRGFPVRPLFAAVEPGRGRWQILAQHESGSLEALVSRARTRNLVLSGTLLMLLLATVYMLVRFSRKAHELAELQMNFVAGVSHELRTPLTVIRTAAFNLRGAVVRRPEQVERYGTMIEQEAERLTALVEQVLQFAGTRAGLAIRKREPVDVDKLLEAALAATSRLAEGSAPVVEKQIEPGLPAVLGDEVALRHAIQNLIDNALKYGAADGNWIGITARPAASTVEIRIADRGPGIQRDEQARIFDAFFRGRRAIEDQIHGTGLGLHLVKEIVEAHGGTVAVESKQEKGAEFILRLPAAPIELKSDEFAHSAGRG
jgi:signal transduction histidine kinase